MIRVVSSVGHDEMVKEMQSHGIAGTLYLLGDMVVVATWLDVSAWVVVGECYNGGVAKYRFLYD